MGKFALLMSQPGSLTLRSSLTAAALVMCHRPQACPSTSALARKHCSPSQQGPFYCIKSHVSKQQNRRSYRDSVAPCHSPDPGMVTVTSRFFPMCNPKRVLFLPAWVLLVYQHSSVLVPRWETALPRAGNWLRSGTEVTSRAATHIVDVTGSGRFSEHNAWNGAE